MTHVRQMDVLILLGLVASACGTSSDPANGHGTNGDSDVLPADGPVGDAATCSPVYATPLDRSHPLAVLVTSQAMASAFQPLADFHTAVGVTTNLVTVETACAGGCNDADPTRDKAHAIKAYLAAQSGLRYVILGGDIEVVPSRRVHDSYQNPMDPLISYDADFYTDYYYADLSQWDTNGDGVYAEDGVDAPDYTPELAVARIPASTATEAQSYIAKVESYMQAYPADRLTDALLVSDVAASYMSVDIDSAWYFEDAGRTSSLMPTGFTVDKLYATALTPDPLAPSLTLSALEAAFATGYNLIVHNGHGSEDTLIYTPDGELTGAVAAGLTSSVQPILLSCACLAGSFNEPDQVLTTDAAGERLVLNPAGGAIAYLGNTAIGLGLAGGSQLIDEVLRYISANSSPLVGDALLAGHTTMPKSDDFTVPSVSVGVPVVDQDSYEWTQKTAELLGDPLLPVWTAAPAAAPTLTVTTAPLCSGTRVTVTVSPVLSGRVRLIAGATVYDAALTETATVFDIHETPAAVTAGLVVAGHLYRSISKAL